MSALAPQSRPAALERYVAAFAARPAADNALERLRRAALERFLAGGFPTQRQEAWKYTNLRRLENRSFTYATPFAMPTATGGAITALERRLVFVNGRLIPALSRELPQPPGVAILGLGAWATREPDAVAAALAPHADGAESFEDLNSAFFEDGLLIDLAANAQLDEPLYVVHLTTGDAPRMTHPRILVRAARGSRCTLIEHAIGPAGTEYFTNAVTSIALAEGAALTHYRVQQEGARSFHVGTCRVRMHRDSRYDSHCFAFGASLARDSVTARLEGAGAGVALHGLFAPAGTQHIDTHTRTEHAAPHTASRQEYRGIAADRGRGVFNGKVVVEADAQQTDARQSSRNLLLSAGAEIDSRPELEIHADDVKCSHGATTGQLDATSVFYLRTRGLSEGEARAVLIRAFADSVVRAIDCQPLARHLEQMLDERFHGRGES